MPMGQFVQREAQGSGFPQTRWSLIGRLHEDGVASVVIERYASSIDRYLRLKFPIEAGQPDFEDLVHDVLIHLLENPDVLARAKPGEGSRFRYYLMTLAWNEARNRLRRLRRRSAREITVSREEAVALGMPAPEQARIMDRAWAETVVSSAWDEVRAWAAEGTVDSDVPAVLEAALIRGRSLRDVAQELGLSLTTCQRRLARGRLLLLQAVSDRLRESGELDHESDGAAACDRLLDLLRGDAC